MRRAAQTATQWWWPGLLLVGLLHTPGGPTLPRHLPSNDQIAGFVAEPLTRTTVITGAVLLGWLLWGLLALTAISALYRRVTRFCRRLPRMRLPGPVQSLAAAVLGTVAVSGAGAAASAAPPAAHVGLTQTDPGQRPPSGPVAHWPVTGAVTDPAPSRATAVTGPAAGSPTASAAQGNGRAASYTVRQGDTLWSIAKHQLGNPERWAEIYHLNRERYDRHGRMRGGDHIEPGWSLTLPAGARVPGNATPPPPTHHAASPSALSSPHSATTGSPPPAGTGSPTAHALRTPSPNSRGERAAAPPPTGPQLRARSRPVIRACSYPAAAGCPWGWPPP
ncbi:LysM peptidoglycan-binding domain-containing protein [Rugosimonospora africana]|uniref:LysM domain-containing protein n=1 Tax=Rugosimonospora africana TaxID=556532 RepID=A0A8J3R1J5_9ACTN|nr:LysM peptidoglycan-binding domain-containing protein [Rugosimonospora africana]GIH19670.1 hypothetical protein Raf01_78420 [Rugosimonospora africana]